MKITCEIDWIDEDESLDEALQQRVIDQVVKAIAAKFSNDMFKEVEEKASHELAEKVDALQTKLLERFTNKEIRVTDRWGDVKAEYENVDELLKSKFDKFLTERVDRNGYTSTSCYTDKPYTRLDFVLDKRVKDASEKLTKQIADEVDQKLKKKTAEIHQKTVEQITKKLGLEV